jgi:hypothetical protein
MNEQIFNKFMKKRFPHERDQSYIEEWREKFIRGNPEKYMDSKSLQIYREVAMEYLIAL